MTPLDQSGTKGDSLKKNFADSWERRPGQAGGGNAFKLVETLGCGRQGVLGYCGSKDSGGHFG